MTTVADRLRQISSKVERAKRHVQELDREIKSFLHSNPYRVGAKRDPETGQLVYDVTSIVPTPEVLPLIAGDVIQNLMSALGHLAYQLVCSDTNDAPPKPDGIYFPIADTMEKYEAVKRGKV